VSLGFVNGGCSVGNDCAAHTRDAGGNRFGRDMLVIPAGLSIFADLRRFLALSKRFPD